MLENILYKLQKIKQGFIYYLKYIFYFKFIKDIPELIHLIFDAVELFVSILFKYSKIFFIFAINYISHWYANFVDLIFVNVIKTLRKICFYYRIFISYSVVNIEHYFIKSIEFTVNKCVYVYNIIKNLIIIYAEDSKFKLRIFSILLFSFSLFMATKLQYKFNNYEDEEYTENRNDLGINNYRNFDELIINESYKATETFQSINDLKKYFDERNFNSKYSKNLISLVSNQLKINKSKANIVVEMEITGGYTDYVKPFIVSMEVKFDNENSMLLSWDTHDNKYIYEVVEKPLILHERVISGGNVSGYSLRNNLIKSGVPRNLVLKFIKIFNYDIDFQRDLSDNYKFSIVFYDYKSLDGELVKSDDIVYAKFINHNRKFEYYRYYKNNKFEYYNELGVSRVKSLMKTPVAAGNLTSRFGIRKHPVLGFTKLHKGIDFGSKPGTRVYAAGDGVVEIAKRSGSFGIYIKIRHPNKLHTLYAHLKGIAKGIGVGKRVKQGDTIGYVGSTGRSTGPHLHYEVHKNNVAVDPLRLNLRNRGSKLNKTQMREFKKIVNRFENVK